MAMRETLSRWDPADHMKSEADIAAYLAACMEEAADDPAFMAAVLDDIARARARHHIDPAEGV